MQTALHILSLVNEIRSEMTGGEIVSTEFYKKERAAYFFVKRGKVKSCLAFIFHPVGFGFYLVPSGKIKIETREKPWPIFALDGARISEVEQLGLDRLFRITCEKDGETKVCVFEAIGPNGNIWVLDSDEKIRGTLRKRDFKSGETYSPATLPDRLNPFDLSGVVVEKWLKDTAGSSPSMVTFIEKQVLGFNRTMAKEAVTRADIDFVELDQISDNDLNKLAETITDMAERFRHPDAGYLYDIRGNLEAYPFKLRTVDTQPEKFKTLSLAVMAMSSRRKSVVQEADTEKQVTDAVSKALKKLERRVPRLQKDISEAADFEKYRKYGELLQINLPNIQKGMKSITVEDVYSPTSEPVTIKLDPALPPHENVEAYFRKYRKGREGLELLQRRLEITGQEIDELRQILGDLEKNFDSAYERFRSDIDSLLPRSGEQKDTAAPRLPFREYHLSTGLKIYVGRDGSDNDRTTFEYARPYELWFHTQQCPGSHVVIKYPNKSFEPSKGEIEEAASIAAFHSKAKNDSLVPVVYTERRYVRKPRGAKPGLVTVEREKSIMVAPHKPADE